MANDLLSVKVATHVAENHPGLPIQMLACCLDKFELIIREQVAQEAEDALYDNLPKDEPELFMRGYNDGAMMVIHDIRTKKS